MVHIPATDVAMRMQSHDSACVITSTQSLLSTHNAAVPGLGEALQLTPAASLLAMRFTGAPVLLDTADEKSKVVTSAHSTPGTVTVLKVKLTTAGNEVIRVVKLLEVVHADWLAEA